MTRTKNRKTKPLMWVEDIDPYHSGLLVLVGVEDKKEVFRYLKKIKALVPFSKWVLTEFDDWKETMEKNSGQFCWNDKLEGGGSGAVLMLRPYADAWNYWEILIHELCHVVNRLGKQKGFLEEMEAQAYLQEHLFHSIRRKLQGIEKP